MSHALTRKRPAETVGFWVSVEDLEKVEGESAEAFYSMREKHLASCMNHLMALRVVTQVERIDSGRLCIGERFHLWEMGRVVVRRKGRRPKGDLVVTDGPRGVREEVRR